MVQWFNFRSPGDPTFTHVMSDDDPSSGNVMGTRREGNVHSSTSILVTSLSTVGASLSDVGGDERDDCRGEGECDGRREIPTGVEGDIPDCRAFLDLTEALKCPHFGHTYSGITRRSAGVGTNMDWELTSIFPHALFDETVVHETLLADEGVAGAWRLKGRIVVAEQCISNFIIPLLAGRGNRVRRGDR